VAEREGPTLEDCLDCSGHRDAWGGDPLKKEQTLPNGAFSAWSYDLAGRLTQAEHKASAGGSVFARFAYGYDAAGNRTSQTDFDGTTTTTKAFGYDAAFRLTSETVNGSPTLAYGYDPAGNRTSLAAGGSTRTYLYDDDNRLLSISDGTTFGYDKNGSTIAKTTAAGTTTYSYDAARRMTSVAAPGDPGVTFAYDGAGARTRKTVGGTTVTTYLNDTRSLTQVLQATTGSATLSYAPGLLQHTSAQGGAAAFSFFHGDAQNNRVLTDGAAGIANRWEFDPFGIVRSATNPNASEFGYAGEQKDAETGLVNLRARYYDPALGRFLARDALSGRAGFPQSLNRYAYALNNPVGILDPSGYSAVRPNPGQCTGSMPGCESVFQLGGYHGGSWQSEWHEAVEEARRDSLLTDNGSNSESIWLRLMNIIRDIFGITILDSSNNYMNVVDLIPVVNIPDPRGIRLINYNVGDLDVILQTFSQMSAKIGGGSMELGIQMFREVIRASGIGSRNLYMGNAWDLRASIEGAVVPGNGLKDWSKVNIRGYDREEFAPESDLVLLTNAWVTMRTRFADPRFLIAHEIGHVADIRRDLTLSGSCRCKVRPKLNELEGFADAFALHFYPENNFRDPLGIIFGQIDRSSGASFVDSWLSGFAR
jgi:RHS repeat-associated protein